MADSKKAGFVASLATMLVSGAKATKRGRGKNANRVPSEADNKVKKQTGIPGTDVTMHRFAIVDGMLTEDTNGSHLNIGDFCNALLATLYALATQKPLKDKQLSTALNEAAVSDAIASEFPNKATLKSGNVHQPVATLVGYFNAANHDQYGLTVDGMRRVLPYTDKSGKVYPKLR